MYRIQSQIHLFNFYPSGLGMSIKSGKNSRNLPIHFDQFDHAEIFERGKQAALHLASRS